MVGDFISRDAAIKKMKDLHFNCKDFHICGGVLLELNALETIPAADVAPVRHASWIEDGYNDEPCVCSNCGEPGKPEWRFCPNCGAIMDGGNDDDYGCVSV